MKFREHKGLDLSQINKDVLRLWDDRNLFLRSLEERAGRPTFVFYEGPPSANGMPGIHHVMARAIKDIFCRYKTQKGYLVERKAGWDTHGLPVELAVEKMLGITKEDIGKKISVEEYNQKCREEVMKYTGEWERLTREMGYWVDMKHPYITYESNYIETLWWLLKQLYDKGLMYKGYTIQPYSPAAGTGLSTHELNQPGCYRDVKDTTCVAMFEVADGSVNALNELQQDKSVNDKPYFLAWTTTPWTLPSNTALAVGPNIEYVIVQTYNPYSGEKCRVVLAKNLLNTLFLNKEDYETTEFKGGGKAGPYKVIGECTGKQLAGLGYKQLFPWVNPGEGAFRVITGDYVTTEDGTGIVHIAPTFGADDDRVAKINGVPPLMMLDKAENRQPMVDKQGRFFAIENLDSDFVNRQNLKTNGYADFAGRYVKNEYDSNLTEKDPSLDVDLVVWLKQRGLLFKSEKYLHNYPHCWRTDKPVLYYPLDSWFIKTTACRERLMELNNTITWKPESTGTGRFGRWLENLQDWNLSRSRYWGTPLPIWSTEDGTERKCIGSMEELMSEIAKSMAAGVMTKNPYEHFKTGDLSKENYDKLDLHRPFIDEVVLVSGNGQPMRREADLIDVWFDSGAMPYAQVHYPFENKDVIDKGTAFPADFIAEGVDQTRGWFFTLHAIGTMVFDSIAFKNVISNGLVLDKNGNKMSKRLGNGVDPFEAIEKYGADAVRWYMITNSQPWDNLKFDIEGVDEVRRKFFGTLYNTYSFFALYANVDGFIGKEEQVPVNERPEIDRWIISLLNTLIKEVDESYASYEPTRAGRLIQEFVGDNLSNWYVRLNRKRFWGGEYNKDKVAAYQTLYTCLETVALLASPIAPFYTDQLYGDLLEGVTGESKSVHLADFPQYNEALIDKGLEERMALAQQVTSMILSLRRRANIKVRQPLEEALILTTNIDTRKDIWEIRKIIQSETNIKGIRLEHMDKGSGSINKVAKANFKTLGVRCGKNMKEVAQIISRLDFQNILELELQGYRKLVLKNNSSVDITLDDVEILTQDLGNNLSLTEKGITVVIDTDISEELHREGVARELINRIQNIRKESNFDVTDKIKITLEEHSAIEGAITDFKDYIAAQTLAVSIEWGNPMHNVTVIDLDDDVNIKISVEKI